MVIMQALAAALRANTVGVFHLVAEGIADALAINAREDGAALAVGGTSGFGRLARLDRGGRRRVRSSRLLPVR